MQAQQALLGGRSDCANERRGVACLCGPQRVPGAEPQQEPRLERYVGAVQLTRYAAGECSSRSAVCSELVCVPLWIEFRGVIDEV